MLGQERKHQELPKQVFGYYGRVDRQKKLISLRKKKDGNFLSMGCKISMVSRSVFLGAVSRDIFMSTTIYGVILHRNINANTFVRYMNLNGIKEKGRIIIQKEKAILNSLRTYFGIFWGPERYFHNRFCLKLKVTRLAVFTFIKH